MIMKNRYLLSHFIKKIIIQKSKKLKYFFAIWILLLFDCLNYFIILQIRNQSLIKRRTERSFLQTPFSKQWPSKKRLTNIHESRYCLIRKLENEVSEFSPYKNHSLNKLQENNFHHFRFIRFILLPNEIGSEYGPRLGNTCQFATVYVHYRYCCIIFKLNDPTTDI